MFRDTPLKITPVILSGGRGGRLWPLSRVNMPKQFLHLAGEHASLTQQTAQRVADRAIFNAPIVVCNEAHRFLVAEQLRDIGIEDATIILEPAGRNTAPAIGLAAHYIASHSGESVLAVLPSDHRVLDDAAFIAALDEAVTEALNHRLVTLGIKPGRPETGYGYIKIGDAFASSNSYHVARFVEKPDADTALAYVQSGNYYWNSGIFCFTPQTFLKELDRHQPDMAANLTAAAEQFQFAPDFIRVDKALFEAIEGNSIDYAVMERTEKAAIVPVDCGWRDIGSWDVVWDLHEKDDRGNAIQGDATLSDTTNSLISCQEGVKVVTLGVNNLIIVSTGDCIMVADKNRAQDVKQLVNDP